MMPTYKTTFMKYETELRVDLNTAFPLPSDEDSRIDTHAASPYEKDWIEYALPPIDEVRGTPIKWPHTIRIPIVISPASLDTDVCDGSLKHYTDPTAFAPILAIPTQVKDHPYVRCDLHDEDESELRRFRYDTSVFSRLPHAGQMWEAVVRA
jgi:hypothetical protein